MLLAGRGVEPVTGGHERYVRVHARALAAAGFEPHLFAVTRPAGRVATSVGLLHRTRTPWPWTWQIAVPLQAPLLAREVERFLAGRPGPHVIHGFGLWGYVGVVAARRLARRGVRAVAVTSLYDTMAGQARAKLSGVDASHGRSELVRRSLELAWTLAALSPYERTLYRDSAALLVNYASVARLYAARYGPRPDVRHIPYTTEAAFTPPPADAGAPPTLAGLRPAGAPLVVAVSRHDPRKGVDILLQALDRLRQRGIPFRACLVGTGSLLAVHRQHLRALDLEAQVAIVGWVPDPGPYLRVADVYVLPSLAEGSGSLSLIEALQAGRPVVASACDGVPEDVTDGQSALLVPPGSVEGLAGGLGRVLGDEPLRRHLARGAREAFAARFSPAAFVEALRAAYADLGVVAPAP